RNAERGTFFWVYYSSQLVLMGAEFTRAYAQRRVSENVSASYDRPTDATGVDHYVHLAVGRSPMPPPSWRCWSGGFWPASSFAVHALEGRPPHSAHGTPSAELLRPHLVLQHTIAYERIEPWRHVRMSEVSSRTPRTRDGKQSRRSARSATTWPLQSTSP